VTARDDDFGDALDLGRTDAPDRWFDRFVFEAHPVDAVSPTLHIGFGAYPARGVADGFVLAVTDAEQRNHRFSGRLADALDGSLGAFSWRTVEPMRQWHAAHDETASGVAFDLTWTARTPAWHGTVTVGDPAATTTAFDHLFQSGTYTGWIAIDGERRSVDGWIGARDRSRGVRTLRGGQGLHLWVLAHFPDRTIGALLVEDRSGGRILLEGAVLTTDGDVVPIVDARHDLSFDALLDLDAARLVVTAADGTEYRIAADTSARGGWMAGGGYGGHHGVDRGGAWSEDDVYPLDGSVGPATLDTALTDRTTRFLMERNGEQQVPGIGVLEFARTRSPRYTYRPTI
jgi:hypothetical protein